MYIVIEILGKQYKIYKNLKIKTDRIYKNKGSLVILNKIIFFSSKKYFIINRFLLNKILIIAKVLKHGKDKKIKILKFKRRKGYKKNIGFRKKYTILKIDNINLNFFNIINGSKKIWRFF